MPSSPLPSPTTNPPAAITSPQAPPPTTPEASKEAKKIPTDFSEPNVPRLSSRNTRAYKPSQAALHAKISVLAAQIAATQAQIDAIKPQLKSPTPETTVKQHIALLHAYNEIRDVGQGLLGMVAENRGVRVRDVYGEFGVAEGD
ncbi:hypothetical protein MMC15_008341 [Xylographa vitiligo]|nr:hypothetical protein [Xylographa vitiligo]